MKIFAQHGAMCGERLDAGFQKDYVDGVVYSPRDIGLDNLKLSIAKLSKLKPKAELLLDPQFYACFLARDTDSRLMRLGEDYQDYFRARTRSQLEREQAVNDDLARCLRFQKNLDVTSIIAPNILIPRSFNSIEAVIAKNYVRNARAQFAKLKDKRPLYVTLAISRNALTDKKELEEFLNELTVMEQPPDGYYLLVGASEARMEIFNADTIAAWMLINHSLAVNGFRVINGFSDLMSPFLGAVGAYAGCTGWFSNLRSFSLGRFLPAGGGRLPVQRYLSMGLLNRITFTELEAIKKKISGILNKLPTDDLYDRPDAGSEPARNEEVFQSWEALRALGSNLGGGSIESNVKACQRAINKARDLYTQIPIALDVKSNDDHVGELDDGLKLFADLAEIKLPSN